MNGDGFEQYQRQQEERRRTALIDAALMYGNRVELRVTKGPNVSTDTKNLVVKLTKKCLREMSKKKYEISREPYDEELSYSEMLRDINIHVKKRGQHSNGGYGEITIDVSRYEKGNTHLHEYKAYKDDPVIGEFDADPETVLLGTVAHEVAHFIQRTYGPSTRHLENICKKPHGYGFKWIYRQIRIALVNDRVSKTKLKETV